METYTWEVLPPELKSQDVVEQLAAEYKWTLAQLAKRGLGIFKERKHEGRKFSGLALISLVCFFLFSCFPDSR